MATLLFFVVAVMFAGFGRALAVEPCLSWQVKAPPPAILYLSSVANMAYDSGRGVTVMFGGYGPGETWEWNGSVWTLRATSGPPTNLHPPAPIAYDSIRGVTVLFQGNSVTGIADAWEWDGNSWTVHATGGDVPMFSPRAAAFDSARGVFVVAPSESTGTTWEWNGDSWTDTTVPVHAGSKWMTFDEARNQTVLITSNSLWEWDGAQWVDRGPVPAGLNGGPLVYDSIRQKTITMGTPDYGFPVSEFFEWDGATWSES